MSAKTMCSAVKAAGYDDAQMIEIVLHVALNTWTNYINEVAKTDIDFPVVDRPQGGARPQVRRPASGAAAGGAEPATIKEDTHEPSAASAVHRRNRRAEGPHGRRCLEHAAIPLASRSPTRPTAAGATAPSSCRVARRSRPS